MKIISITGALLALALLGTGCTKPAEPIGPAQKAGAAIDNAGDEVAAKMQESLKKAQQASKDMADAAKATGTQITDATKDATADASKSLDKATEEVGKKVERAGEKIQEASHK